MTIHQEMNQQTKSIIKRAFIEQIQQLGFQHVTVKHIAQCAHVNRGTFYLHYKDKYDLMEQLKTELIHELSLHVEQVQPAAAFQHVRSELLYPPFIAIFHYISSQRAAFKALLGEQGDPAFRKQLKLMFSEVLLTKLIMYSDTIHQPHIAPYFRAFLTSAIIGIIEEWLDQKHERQTAEDMALIHFSILQLVSQFSQSIHTKHNEADA